MFFQTCGQPQPGRPIRLWKTCRPSLPQPCGMALRAVITLIATPGLEEVEGSWRRCRGAGVLRRGKGAMAKVFGGGTVTKGMP